MFSLLHYYSVPSWFTIHGGARFLPQVPPRDQSYITGISTFSIPERSSVKFRNIIQGLQKQFSVCYTHSFSLGSKTNSTSVRSAVVCTWWCTMRRPTGETRIKALIEALEQHVTAALACVWLKSSHNCSLVWVTGRCKGFKRGPRCSNQNRDPREEVCVRLKCVPPLCYFRLHQIIDEKKLQGHW